MNVTTDIELMKYIKTKYADRIKELTDKGWCNYAAGNEPRDSMEGMYKGQGGTSGVCVNGLSVEEREELIGYNFVTRAEQWDMQKAGRWGTPTLASNGKIYMR